MPSKSNRPALPGLPPVRTASADTRDMLELVRGLSLSAVAASLNSAESLARSVRW